MPVPCYPQPPAALSLFPIIKSLYFLHLFLSYLFFLPFTVVICFASLIPPMNDTTRSFSFPTDLFHLTWSLYFYPRHCKWQDFLLFDSWVPFLSLWPSSISHPLYPSSGRGHRGSSHSVATVDPAAVDIGVQVSWSHCICTFEVSSGCSPAGCEFELHVGYREDMKRKYLTNNKWMNK